MTPEESKALTQIAHDAKTVEQLSLPGFEPNPEPVVVPLERAEPHPDTPGTDALPSYVPTVKGYRTILEQRTARVEAVLQRMEEDTQHTPAFTARYVQTWINSLRAALRP